MSARDPEALRRFWERVAERLQRNGLRPYGRLTLGDLDRSERHALAGLIGQPVQSDRVTVDLATLDERVRASGVALGLVALTERHAGPLVDRPALRRHQLDVRANVWESARVEVAAAGLAGRAWVEAWLEDVRRAGVLGRLAPERALAVATAAVHCLARLPVLTGDPPLGRGNLASVVAGNAHALDDGAVLASVVLRGVASLTGAPYPATPAARRALWRSVSIHTDEVSTTVLTIGLRSASGCGWLDDRSAAGWETHFTLRDLRRLDARPSAASPDVYVCENPRLIETALDAGTAAAAVCTQGQPSVVVTTLLGQLRSAGARLRYHGDFDWPGVTIANAMIGTHGCEPWRMSADDYESAVARLAPLVGELPTLGDVSVIACWDARLTQAMTAARRAIHEELVLDDLLADMATS